MISKLKILIAVSAMSVLFSFTKQQTDFSLARAEKSGSKLIFYRNEPINEYEQVFTFASKVPNFYCVTYKEAMIGIVNSANQEAGLQNRLYDAIIITEGDREIAIVWKDKSKDNAIARVKRKEGKYLFEACEPIANYDIMGKYNVEGLGQQLILGTCPTHDEKIAKLMRKAEKDKLDYNAIIYNSSTNDLAIRMK